MKRPEPSRRHRAVPRTSRAFRARAGRSVIRYGYSTRAAGYPDFYDVLEKAGPLTVPDQTHSAHIRSPRAARTRTMIPDCDALVTAVQGQVLTVRTADCLPITLWDKTGKAVAIVHAGWKGTHQKIAAKTVARLKRLGVEPRNLRVVFGPAIRSCCYEVGPEFADRFPAQTLRSGRNGRFQFDLVLANRLQLQAAGVPAGNFKDLGLCTACDTRTFFSFRRDPSNAGRMIHWIRKS